MLAAFAAIEEWVPLKNLSYDPMQEAIDLRSLENPSQSTISAPLVTYGVTLLSQCWGSSEQTSPWTSPYASLFTEGLQGWYDTSGQVSAVHIRHWQLKWWNTGGEQKWRKTSDNSTYERTRVNRSNPEVVSWEVPMTQGPGGPS